MTEGEKKTEEREETPEDGAAAEAIETEAELTADPEAAPDPGSDLEAEVAELRNQLLRAMAETENLRRRSQREREEAVRYAAAPLLRDLLSVADNLERALTHVPEGAAEQDAALKNLLEGMHLTERELHAVLERHQVTRIDPWGEKLDPHLHEAMFEVPRTRASRPAPSSRSCRVGYKLHDRLLRPARVGVAKGGAGKGRQGDNASEPGSHVDTSA